MKMFICINKKAGVLLDAPAQNLYIKTMKKKKF